MPEWAKKEVILPMEQDNSHLRIQDGFEQAKTFPSEHVSPADRIVDQEEKSFTDKDKAILRTLLLELIFSEPRVKSHAE
jgi:hypothetical protein